MIEWVENGERKTNEPEPSRKFKIAKTILTMLLIMFTPYGKF